MQTLRSIFVTALFAGMAGWTAARGTMTVGAVPPEVRLLKEAKTFKVEVEQKYGELEGFELPFALVAEKLLQAGGLEPVEEGGDADITVRIQAKGTPLSRALSRRASVMRRTACGKRRWGC